ncbi:MAG: M56 family metallopeptidase [Chitinophagaceae bacterium]|nr:M56 family metallopeptidase [Chitinophagaceae bacterium]
MGAINQSNFLQALGWAVLNSLWQMALLWVVYQLITAVFKTVRSSQKSLLASLLAIGGFTWFLLTLASILYKTENAVIGSAGLINLDGNEQLNDWLFRTLPIASLLYLILLIFPLLQFVRNYRYVNVIRKYGLSKATVEWRMFVRKVAAQMGIKKPVHIWVSELVTSPVTIGYIKPVILVPLAAVNQLSTQQLEAVLLHELAHIRRFDYLLNLILKFIQSILYFNPFVKAFVKIVEREREKSCDEMVMQFQYDPYGYASALLELEKANHLPKTLAVAAGGKKNDLLHRVEWIMGVNKQPVFSFNKLAGVLAGLLCLITFNALLILSKPVHKINSGIAATTGSLSSPFYLFMDDDKKAEAVNAAETAATIVNNIEPYVKQIAASIDEKEAAIMEKELEGLGEKIEHAIANPFAVAATHFAAPEAPELKNYQEEQVKEAIDASKRVLQEKEWEEVEKNIAEVFTQQQKEALKAEYLKKINKVDWKKWENELRLAYNKVNWEQVNAQLANAVTNIRIDSLQHVYNKAMMNLSVVERQLSRDSLAGIPDSDITLEVIEQKKAEVSKALNQLRGIKAKKIVRL